MRGVFGSIGRWGGLLPAALALLLLFRLLVPAGYMIAPDGRGAPGLVLCAAPAQPATEIGDHGGHARSPADQSPPASGDRPCAFAALSAPPLPPAPPVLPEQAPAVVAPPGLPYVTALPPIAPAAPPPPATGPPLPA